MSEKELTTTWQIRQAGGRGGKGGVGAAGMGCDVRVLGVGLTVSEAQTMVEQYTERTRRSPSLQPIRNKANGRIGVLGLG